MKNSSITFEKTKYINPNNLSINEEKFTILGRSKNYGEMCDSIRNQGILTPLLVNKSNTVISGNLRLIIALELKMKLVPVNYVNFDESNMVTLLHTDVTREKTLSEKLNMYFILREKYEITQGSRTDRNEKKKEQKKEFEEKQPLSEYEEKIIKKLSKSYSREEIIYVIKELEISGEKVKLSTVVKKLNEKKSNVHSSDDDGDTDSSIDTENHESDKNPVFITNFELSIDYYQLLDLKTLKQEVGNLHVNGGSVFITNVDKDRDWKLNKKMFEVGMMLYTIKETAQNTFIYHFIFTKSNTTPMKQIETKIIQLEQYEDLKLIG